MSPRDVLRDMYMGPAFDLHGTVGPLVHRDRVVGGFLSARQIGRCLYAVCEILVPSHGPRGESDPWSFDVEVESEGVIVSVYSVALGKPVRRVVPVCPGLSDFDVGIRDAYQNVCEIVSEVRATRPKDGAW